MRSSALHVSNLESYIGCKVLQNGALNPFEALSASPSAQKTVKAEVNLLPKCWNLVWRVSIDSNIYAERATYVACEASYQDHCREFFPCVEEVVHHFPTRSHDNTRPNSEFCV